MSDQNNAISQTVRRQTGNRDVLARLPVLQVVGSGESLEALRIPKFVSCGDILEIGRRPVTSDPQVALTLPDRTVSSVHARITRTPQAADDFVIQDLGSTNGTSIDGKRIERPTALHSGAVIFLGSQVLVFRLVTPSELVAMQEEARHPLGPLPSMS